MTQPPFTEIAILGAGVIGLAIAERLAAEGREVVLVDPGRSGHGRPATAMPGTIADYAVLPVGTPEVLRTCRRFCSTATRRWRSAMPRFRC
jgi:glycine/D-amino acid oxidase-like deaminating enzyme